MGYNKYNQARIGNTNKKNTPYYTTLTNFVITELDKLEHNERVNYKELSYNLGIDQRMIGEIIVNLYYKKQYPLIVKTEGRKRLFYVQKEVQIK